MWETLGNFLKEEELRKLKEHYDIHKDKYQSGLAGLGTLGLTQALGMGLPTSLLLSLLSSAGWYIYSNPEAQKAIKNYIANVSDKKGYVTPKELEMLKRVAQSKSPQDIQKSVNDLNKQALDVFRLYNVKQLEQAAYKDLQNKRTNASQTPTFYRPYNYNQIYNKKRLPTNNLEKLREQWTAKRSDGSTEIGNILKGQTATLMNRYNLLKGDPELLRAIYSEKLPTDYESKSWA